MILSRPKLIDTWADELETKMRLGGWDEAADKFRIEYEFRILMLINKMDWLIN